MGRSWQCVRPHDRPPLLPPICSHRATRSAIHAVARQYSAPLSPCLLREANVGSTDCAGLRLSYVWQECDNARLDRRRHGMIPRRSFFATLLAPLVSRFIPRNTLLDTINRGINPEWDGTIGEGIEHNTVYSDGALDAISVVTRRYLDANPLLNDVFVRSPFSALMLKEERILDAGGQIVGHYGRMPGEPWFRLRAALSQPERAPRLPA